MLVAATDGVGTKLRIAIDTGLLDNVGVDLVAMCVNDLVCQGAEPLFFLDYFATGKLAVDEAARVVEGIAAGCRQSGCALIGGETAEMPGMYHAGDFDLAGFAVGAVERGAVLPAGGGGGRRAAGAAVGRRAFQRLSRWCARWSRRRGWLGRCRALRRRGTLGQALVAPTRLYVKPVLAAIRAGGVHAAAHITGGGITENLPRVLPEGLGARVDLDAWTLPPVFDWLAETGGIADAEMLKTFNSGIGMILAVAADRAEALQAVLVEQGETVVRLGTVDAGAGVSYSGTLR